MTTDAINKAIDALERGKQHLFNPYELAPGANKKLCANRINEAITALQSQPAPVVDGMPEGWGMSEEQRIVWDWASSHGLTLVTSECDDLLSLLGKARKQADHTIPPDVVDAIGRKLESVGICMDLETVHDAIADTLTLLSPYRSTADLVKDGAE